MQSRITASCSRLTPELAAPLSVDFVTQAHTSTSRRLSFAAATLCLLLSGSLSVAVEAQPAVARLSLGDAARMAARQNGAIDISRARAEQAEARALQRRNGLFPDLSAGVAEASHTLNSATFGIPFGNPNGELIGPVPTLDLRYKLQAPLFNAGLWGSWRAAQAAAAAAQSDVATQADAAAAAAASTYLRAARAEAQLQARRADSTLADELLGIARDQLEAGTGIALDVTRAQSQLAAVRAQIIAARNDRDRTILELKRVLGMAADAELVLTDSLAGLPLSSPLLSTDEALKAAESSRADIQSLEALEEAQQQAVKAIRLERLPQLGLAVDHGIIGKSAGHMLQTYTWGLQLSVGVFDGFRRESRMQEQVAAVRESEVRLRELRAQSSLEVRAALLNLGSAREQVEAVEEQLRLTQQEVSQAEERFKAGVAGNAEVITAMFSLNQARTLRNDALAAYHGARIALAAAMGEAQKLP